MKRLSAALLIALIPALVLAVVCPMTAMPPGDSDLVHVRVNAIDGAKSRPVKGLRREDFKMFEDSTPQNIVSVSEDNTPILLGVLLDTDAKTKAEVKAKVLPVLSEFSIKDDESFVLESGNTPLNDAVLQALDTLVRRGSNRKRVLILITSKGNSEAHSFSKVRELLKGQDIQFYATAFQISPIDETREILRELSGLSGGNCYFPSLLFELADIIHKVLAELNNQYLIEYHSTNRATDGKWRKIKVTAEPRDFSGKKVSNLNIRTKSGYYAPTATK